MSIPRPVEIPGWDTERQARFKYAGGRSYPPEIVPAGRNAHIGDGVWLQRCRDAECGESLATWGYVPEWRGIGPHEVEAHGAQVGGINVGMLP